VRLLSEGTGTGTVGKIEILKDARENDENIKRNKRNG